MYFTEIGGIFFIPNKLQILCRSLLFADELVFLKQSLIPTETPFLAPVREFHYSRCYYYLGVEQSSLGCIGYAQECLKDALNHVEEGIKVCFLILVD